MENKTVGRVVEVRTNYLNGPGHITEIFYVAVDDDLEAVSLVKTRIAWTNELVTVLGPLSPSVVSALEMNIRQVKAFGE